ncbi:hypothetical protein [Chitinophaga sancti]|uniref:hypothetical protein n=1 Tax=Chitinophaga sancti TaxID=1004 RepID=UPI003F7A6811
MELSIDNYKNILSKDLVKRSEKCIVRECDEIEKNKYQAYVDENDVSFDVTISLNDKKEVLHHDCDCDSKAAFCQHKIALFLYTGKKGKKKLPGNPKKSNKLDILVNEADIGELRKWVKEILIKNKDMELAFVHHFSSQQNKYTPQEVKKLTLDAVKAVIKNKRKIEAGEVKKIVDLWTEIHLPIVEKYFSGVTDVESFKNFNAIVESYEEIQRKLSSSSNKMIKYLESLFDKALISLNELQHEDDWKLALGYFADQIDVETFDQRINYLSFLEKAIGYNGTSKGRTLIDKLLKQYTRCDPTKFYHGKIYTETLFKIVLNNDLFDAYYKVFKPITFNNDYNELLIENLINSGHVKLAEKYCWEQIKSNFREEYNLRYLQFLKEIATLENDEHKLAEVLKYLFPNTFDFDDFLFIYSRITNEEEKKKWRSKVLSRARQLASQNLDAMKFSFKLMEFDNKYGKMIDYINEYTPYNIILEYAERIILANKKEFLKTIFNKADLTYDMDEEEAMEAIPKLPGLLKKYYTESEIEFSINNALKSGWYHRPNMLISFIRNTKEVKTR